MHFLCFVFYVGGAGGVGTCGWARAKLFAVLRYTCTDG